MKHTVYKSLDRSSSLFGLKGCYLRWTVMGVAADGFLAFAVVGKAVNSIVGFIFFVGVGAAVYIGVMAFQAKFSEREKTRWLAHRRLPDYTFVPPARLSDYAGRTDTLKMDPALRERLFGKGRN